jgi:micrococcal nuclease
VPYDYYATPVRVVDGDTVDMTIDLGFHMKATLRFRLLNADAPEHREPGWAECTEYTKQWLATHTGIKATTYKTDSFGRWLAHVTADNGDDLSQGITALMAEHGWTSPDVR